MRGRGHSIRSRLLPSRGGGGPIYLPRSPPLPTQRPHRRLGTALIYEPTQAVGSGAYLASGAFVEAVFENWESEFLQMGLYVLLTAFLYQQGSAESKDPDQQKAVDADARGQRDKRGAPGPVRRGGLALTLYEHSLTLALLALFVLSILLRQEGSPESKPVPAPHSATGEG